MKVLEGEEAKAMWIAMAKRVEVAAGELVELARKIQTEDVATGTLGEDATAALHSMLGLMAMRGDRVPVELMDQVNLEHKRNFARVLSNPCACESCVAKRELPPLSQRVPNAKLH